MVSRKSGRFSANFICSCKKSLLIFQLSVISDSLRKRNTGRPRSKNIETNFQLSFEFKKSFENRMILIRSSRETPAMFSIYYIHVCKLSRFVFKLKVPVNVFEYTMPHPTDANQNHLGRKTLHHTRGMFYRPTELVLPVASPGPEVDFFFHAQLS